MQRLTYFISVIAVFWGGVVASDADAHSGRRFAVEVVGNKLQAQGINTGPDDGRPAVRPYLNTIHDHWGDVPTLGISVATLPGFDVPAFTGTLVGHRLELDWLSVRRWVDPSHMPTATTRPTFEALAVNDLVSLTGPDATLLSDALGTVTLHPDIPLSGAPDLDVVYQINRLPTDEIIVFEYQLRAMPISGGPSSILPSDSIYAILSPDGDTPMQRLHHASLFLEEYLATVPEPTGVSTAFLVALVTLTARRRSR